jgi:hypothetical protein
MLEKSEEAAGRAGADSSRGARRNATRQRGKLFGNCEGTRAVLRFLPQLVRTIYTINNTRLERLVQCADPCKLQGFFPPCRGSDCFIRKFRAALTIGSLTFRESEPADRVRP